MAARVRAFMSALFVVAILAAAPVALAWWAGWPLPRHWPHGQQWTDWLAHPATLTTITDVIVCAIWLLWATVVAAVLLEVARRIRRVRRPRIRMPAPLHALASSLVGSTLVTLTPHPTATQAVVSVAQPTDEHVEAAVPATAPTLPAGMGMLLHRDCGYPYTVRHGDSLWHIAQLCLGDGRRWPQIWRLNHGRFWPAVSGYRRLSDPDLILPGWTLRLPEHATPPRVPAHHPEPGPTGAPAQPTPSATSTGPTQTSTTPTGTDTAPAAIHTAQGIVLPGGWISAAFGAALVGAALMVWRLRRHRYRPTPITTPVLDDPDLTPPLAVLPRIRHALRQNHPDVLDELTHPMTWRESLAAGMAPVPPPPGPTAAELAGVDRPSLVGGLGLSGPGAHDAARAMLVAILASGADGDRDLQGQAIVPATTLATLIAVSAIELNPIPRLGIAASLAEAMTQLETEIIRRSRILAEHDLSDIAALRDADVASEALPQLLLVADAPESGWQQRLVTAARLGEALDISVVVVGEWPHGTTLSVARDGTTSEGGRRVAVLDTDAAAAALTMLQEANGTCPPDSRPPTATTVALASALPHAAEDLREAETPPAADTAAQPPAVDGASAPAQQRRAQVRVLGTPAVLDATGQPVQKLRAKSVELLVYLVVNRTGAPLAQIMEAIWPDATWRRASERLSTCVANLRNAIRAVVTDSQATDSDRRCVEPVINSGSHYRLNPDVVDVDWWTVLDAYASTATSNHPETQLADLCVAIGAISGGLADGTDYEWADTDREHVRRHQIKIYAQAADLTFHDDPQRARMLLDAACMVDPLSEELARRAMTVAAALGDAEGIRLRLRTLRRALDTAGLDIDATTEQHAADLLRDLPREHRNER